MIKRNIKLNYLYRKRVSLIAAFKLMYLETHIQPSINCFLIDAAPEICHFKKYLILIKLICF